MVPIGRISERHLSKRRLSVRDDEIELRSEGNLVDPAIEAVLVVLEAAPRGIHHVNAGLGEAHDVRSRIVGIGGHRYQAHGDEGSHPLRDARPRDVEVRGYRLLAWCAEQPHHKQHKISRVTDVVLTLEVGVGKAIDQNRRSVKLERGGLGEW